MAGLAYVKSAAGILKIIELVVLIIGIGAVGFFYKEMGIDEDYDKKGNIEAYLAMATIAGVVVIASFLAFAKGVADSFIKAAIVLFGLVAVLLLIGSSLLADAAKYYDDDGMCEALKTGDAIAKAFGAKGTDARCSQLIVGAVSGFIATVLFAVDAFVHFRM